MSSKADTLRRARHWVPAGLGALLWVSWWVFVPRLDTRTATLWWLVTVACWGVALWAPARRRWRPTWTTALALLLIAAATVPRVHRLELEPYRVASDEVCYSWRGLTEMPHHLWELAYGYEGACANVTFAAEAMQAWPAFVLPPLLGIRLASVLYGVATLMLLYAIGRRLYGATPAIVATAILGANYWHLVTSRTAYPNSAATLVLCAALLAVAIGLERQHRWWGFVGGLLTGLTVVAYEPARIAMPLVACWMMYWAIRTERPWRDRVRMLSVVLLGAALYLTPFWRYRGVLAMFDRWRLLMLHVPDSVVQQWSTAGWSSSAGWDLLRERAIHALSVYVGPGAMIAPHEFSPTAIIDPFSLTLALCGLLITLGHWRQSRYALLLLWVVGVFVGGQTLSAHPQYRMGVILPAFALTAGIAAAWIERHALRRLGGWWVSLLALAGLLYVIVPINLRYLDAWNAERSARYEIYLLGRYVGASDPHARYVVIGSEAYVGGMVFDTLAVGRDVRDGTLEPMIDVPARDRDVVFVLQPSLALDAVARLREQYPTAVVVPSTETQPLPPIAVRVPAMGGR